MEKQKKIVNMFNDIAPTYDIANRLLSFGIDQSWRKKACDETFKLYDKSNIERVVDVACGTGDMTEFWLKRAKANSISIEHTIGVDPSVGMLKVAKNKYSHIEFLEGEAIKLPFETDSVDIISITYGIRNVIERKEGFAEFSRVLKKGGFLVILEFMKQDDKKFISKFTNFYTKKMLPFIGGLISGNKEAYQYLPDSIDAFLTKDMMINELKEANLETLYLKDFSFGISSLFIAKRG